MLLPVELRALTPGWAALVRSVGGGARWPIRTQPQRFFFRDYCVLLCQELRELTRSDCWKYISLFRSQTILVTWAGMEAQEFSPSLRLVLFIAPTLSLRSQDSARILGEGAGRCTPAVVKSLP